MPEEPEEVLDFLREYHGVLGPLVSQFEGTLDAHNPSICRRPRGPDRGQRVVATGLSFPELGLHQCRTVGKVQGNSLILASDIQVSHRKH